MYPMSKKSLAIRIALLPVYIVLWVLGGITYLLSDFFEFIRDCMDNLMDKFMNWVNRLAPLDSDKDKKV